ncbi:hypothetical protein V6Z12_D08G251200 [Gossypium hirsutum]
MHSHKHDLLFSTVQSHLPSRPVTLLLCIHATLLVSHVEGMSTNILQECEFRINPEITNEVDPTFAGNIFKSNCF